MGVAAPCLESASRNPRFERAAAWAQIAGDEGARALAVQKADVLQYLGRRRVGWRLLQGLRKPRRSLRRVRRIRATPAARPFEAGGEGRGIDGQQQRLRARDHAPGREFPRAGVVDAGLEDRAIVAGSRGDFERRVARRVQGARGARAGRQHCGDGWSRSGKFWFSCETTTMGDDDARGRATNMVTFDLGANEAPDSRRKAGP